MQTSQSTSSVAGPRWRFKSASSSLGDSSAKNVVLHVLRHCVCVCFLRVGFLTGCVCVCVCVCCLRSFYLRVHCKNMGHSGRMWTQCKNMGLSRQGNPLETYRLWVSSLESPVTGVMEISQNDTRWTVLQFSCVNPHIKYSEATWRAYEQEIKGGASLAVQWLRIHLWMQGAQVLSPVGELRSHKPQGN